MINVINGPNFIRVSLKVFSEPELVKVWKKHGDMLPVTLGIGR